jgi:hypothetical protein
MTMPKDGETKPCEREDCGGTLTFQTKTPVPNTGAVFVDDETSRGPVVTKAETAPAWSCDRCNHVEWISK